MNISPTISPSPSNSPDLSLSRRHHLLDIHMLVVIICLAISFFIIASITFCIRRYVEADNLLDAISLLGSSRRSRPSTVHGLSTIILDTFPIFIYSDVKAMKLGKAALECAVCLSEFVDNESLRLLPECSHVFHRDCIDSWLACRITCPVCRACLIQKPGKLSVFNSSTHLVDNELTQSSLREEKDINMPANDTEHIKNSEKYTLRLPKEVRDELVRLGSSKSGIGIRFPAERSLAKGHRSESCRIGNGKHSPFGYGLLEREVKSERWMFTPTPQCFPDGGGSARWPERRRKSLRFVTSPFDRLFKVAEKDESGNSTLRTESPV